MSSHEKKQPLVISEISTDELDDSPKEEYTSQNEFGLVLPTKQDVMDQFTVSSVRDDRQKIPKQDPPSTPSKN